MPAKKNLMKKGDKPQLTPSPKNTDPTKAPKFSAGAGRGLNFNASGMTQEAVDEKLRHAFGIADADVYGQFLVQLVDSLPESLGPVASSNYTVALLHGIGPQDPLEGILGVQMIGTHNLAMRFLAAAALPQSDQSVEGRAASVTWATKLLRTFTAQVEALTKYRAGGQQKMVVEHVHVHEGGQAIVGNVNHGGGGEA